MKKLLLVTFTMFVLLSPAIAQAKKEQPKEAAKPAQTEMKGTEKTAAAKKSTSTKSKKTAKKSKAAPQEAKAKPKGSEMTKEAEKKPEKK